jgi:hypothetical protein
MAKSMSLAAMGAAIERFDNALALLKLVGTIKSESVLTCDDDGTSQTVVASAGIARVETVRVPNPVSLCPYRTFAEVTQPASKYVVRMRAAGKEGEYPVIVLHEVEDRQWVLEAVALIAFWLKDRAPHVPVIC